MNPRAFIRRAAVVAGAAAIVLTAQVATGPRAEAHPLGNLSVNQYTG